MNDPIQAALGRTADALIELLQAHSRNERETTNELATEIDELYRNAYRALAEVAELTRVDLAAARRGQREDADWLSELLVEIESMIEDADGTRRYAQLANQRVLGCAGSGGGGRSRMRDRIQTAMGRLSESFRALARARRRPDRYVELDRCVGIASNAHAQVVELIRGELAVARREQRDDAQYLDRLLFRIESMLDYSRSHSEIIRANRITVAAGLLHQRIRARAEAEGVGYELSPEFFESHLRAGIRNFFGVIVRIDNERS